MCPALGPTECWAAKSICYDTARDFKTGCNTCCYWNNCKCDSCPGSGGDPSNCSGCPDWKTRCGYCNSKAQKMWSDCDSYYPDGKNCCYEQINDGLQSLAQDIENMVHLSGMIDHLNDSVTTSINNNIPTYLKNIVIPHI